MLTLRTSGHIRSRRNIRSFRAIRNSAGSSSACLDRARLAREKKRLAARETRRGRLTRQWDEHCEGATGAMRVLPPSARANVTRSRASAKKKKAR